MTMQDAIKNALVNYGAALENWKVNVIGIDRCGNSDIAYVTATITKPRNKKPFVLWYIKVDTVRELAYFDQSEFEYL